MSAFRSILFKLYKAKDLYVHHTEVKALMSRTDVDIFSKLVVPKFPSIFHEWFIESFPEPSQWLNCRQRYSSTVAAMSMVGYIVGLGDRHGENILFDEKTGECLHVDLNCLFEKGAEFETPEVVPFRLTHNMVDAFGIRGIEGSYTKCCESSLQVLRDNRDSLMSVLETFLYDPLCEWGKTKHKLTVREDNTELENQKAMKILSNIDRKLQGYCVSHGLPLSVQGQAHELIKTASDPKNLCQMYIGWAPYL